MEGRACVPAYEGRVLDRELTAMVYFQRGAQGMC